MIYSMTGFARHITNADWGTITWEIRSVNHRHLDPHFHLPEKWRDLETDLRQLLQNALSRGKVDIYLSFSQHHTQNAIEINSAALEALYDAYEQVNIKLATTSHINFFDVLRWPGVLSEKTLPNAEIKKTLLQSFNETLEILIKERQREGNALAQFLQEKFNEILEKIKLAHPRREEVLNEQRQKFQQRIQSLQQPFDNNRMEQELLIWAQKSDINEEIERLATHTKEAQRIIEKGGRAIGRQLDFLLQELQREANTLSSKSSDIILTNAAVDIKVYIEQIREQIQNLA